MSARQQRLSETLAALTMIGRRLHLSLAKDNAVFPVTPAIAVSDDPVVGLELDAFLQRFTQTLDHVLRKLFPRLQAAVSESDDLLTVRELLDTLHRLGVIDDVPSWFDLLETRNRLTHEYALDARERAAALNDAWSRGPMLLAQIERVRQFASDHNLMTGVER